MIAFEMHRIFGGPLTGAERAAMHRERRRVTNGNEAVTPELPEVSNERVTAPVTNGVTPVRVCSSSSSSVSRDRNQLLREQATEILAFLNEKAGKTFRFVEVNLGFIEGRLRSGASVQDCKGVIIRKIRDSKDGSFDPKYLRPETLFNRTKFESYLGQKTADV